MSNKVQRRMITVEETIALAALCTITFPVASWDKRFANHLFNADGISEKEVPQLWRLFIRYRRQIDCPRKQELLKLAESLAAPDFRKLRAAELQKSEELQKYRAAMKTETTSNQP